jgi:hypothetical protein
MKKQIFTLILFSLLHFTVSAQFKLDATGTNDMRLRTGNTDRLNILNNGNVGVGTPTPNAKFDVLGDFALSKKVAVTASGTQNALDRQGSSRILINVTGTVTLNGIAGGVDGLMVFLYTGAGTTLIINNLNAAALISDRIATHTGGTVTINGRGGASLIYDSSIGNWRIYGFADENSAWNSIGNVGTNPTTNFIGTTDNQAFAFRTNNVENMRIIPSGNVGVGTTIPSAKMHVKAPGTVANLPVDVATFECEDFENVRILSPTGGSIIFDKPTGTDDGFLRYKHSTSKLELGTNGASKMVIDSSGNVGIGTTSPEAKLDIRGNLRLENKPFSSTVNITYDPLDIQKKSYISFYGNNNVGTVVQTIKGIKAPSTSPNTYGTVLYISNGSRGTIILKNNAATIADDDIYTHDGNDITISGHGGAVLIYDFVGWRVISFLP